MLVRGQAIPALGIQMNSLWNQNPKMMQRHHLHSALAVDGDGDDVAVAAAAAASLADTLNAASSAARASEADARSAVLDTGASTD